MATPQELADFIQRRITVGRVRPGMKHWFVGRYQMPLPYYGPTLPSAAQIAGELIQDGEFRALELGGFLNRPTGKFLEQAVELVVPRALAPEFELLVASLKLAADLQQSQTRSRAFLAVGGTVLIGILVKEIGKRAA